MSVPYTGAVMETPATVEQQPVEGEDPVGSDIVVIGSVGKSEEIARCLEDIAALVRPAASVLDAVTMVGSGTIAVVCSDELEAGSLEEIVSALAQATKTRKLPVFAVVGEGFGDDGARRAYAAGATAIFEWPREVTAMSRLVADMLEIPVKKRVGQRADDAMTETIRARLEADESLRGHAECSVRAGAASLTGEVDSAWKKKRAVGLVEHVPGVQSVDATGLGVVPVKVEDDTLESDVYDVLRSAAAVDRETIAVGASDGVVRMAGTVISRDELERIEHLVENIRGVKQVDNLLTVSARDTQYARVLAGRLEDELDRAFAGLDIEVAVFSDIAILSGTVTSIAEKRQAHRLVAGRPEIRRVVNKIVVA
jgi:osmotically-inducible protein OsmY